MIRIKRSIECFCFLTLLAASIYLDQTYFVFLNILSENLIDILSVFVPIIC